MDSIQVFKDDQKLIRSVF